MSQMVSQEVAERPLLTVKEVAEQLRIGRNHAYLAISRGEIPGVFKLGRSIRIRRAVFDQWLHGPYAPRKD